MNGRLFWIRCIGLIAAAALLAACGSAPSSPTVTVSEEGCTYSGPKQLPTSFTMTWAVKDSKPGADYNLAVVTLGDGKTGGDLEPFMDDADADIPEWLNVIRYSSMLNETQTQDLDLTANAAYHGEPIYIVCIHHSRGPIDFVGPLEVKQQ